MDDNGDFRRPDVLACEAYARQALDSIVRGPDDPFHYRLQELWLDVFQRPWDQPTEPYLWWEQDLRDIHRSKACGTRRRN